MCGVAVFLAFCLKKTKLCFLSMPHVVVLLWGVDLKFFSFFFFFSVVSNLFLDGGGGGGEFLLHILICAVLKTVHPWTEHKQVEKCSCHVQ